MFLMPTIEWKDNFVFGNIPTKERWIVTSSQDIKFVSEKRNYRARTRAWGAVRHIFRFKSMLFTKSCYQNASLLCIKMKPGFFFWWHIQQIECYHHQQTNLRGYTDEVHSLPGLNCRIPLNILASHWIQMVSVLYYEEFRHMLSKLRGILHWISLRICLEFEPAIHLARKKTN